MTRDRIIHGGMKLLSAGCCIALCAAAYGAPGDEAPMPRARMTSSQYPVSAAPAAGPSLKMLKVGKSALTNGQNLIKAYASAKTLTPYGQPLSDTNRAVVLVPPGKYDMGAGHLLLDAEFVDLIGTSTEREHQHIFGQSNGAGTGVLRQTANNVRIANLLIECTRSSGGFPGGSSNPAAYFPDNFSTATVMRNCRFKADDANARCMRTDITYTGTFEDCHGGDYVFGGGALGAARGTFVRCSGLYFAFAGDGIASGYFEECVGDNYSFGSQNLASGTFVRCKGWDAAFGGSFAGNGGTASGTFRDCVANNFSFGGAGPNDGIASGTFTGCVAKGLGFGANGSAAGGKFYHCIGENMCFTTAGSPTVVGCVNNDAAYP